MYNNKFKFMYKKGSLTYKPWPYYFYKYKFENSE